MIRPGKMSRINRSENKASFIQVEEKKEARMRAPRKKKQRTHVQADPGLLKSEVLAWSVSYWDFYVFPSIGVVSKLFGAKFCLCLLVGRGPCYGGFQDHCRGFLPSAVSLPSLLEVEVWVLVRDVGSTSSLHLSGSFPNFFLFGLKTRLNWFNHSKYTFQFHSKRYTQVLNGKKPPVCPQWLVISTKATIHGAFNSLWVCL